MYIYYTTVDEMALQQVECFNYVVDGKDPGGLHELALVKGDYSDQDYGKSRTFFK